ncbi:MAG: hypothetical protein AB7U62_04410 [Pseudolabrys sp.]
MQIDLQAFERRAAEIGGAMDQVPFALANALTSAAFKTREFMINDMWPRYVEVRNRNFLRASLHITKATKRSLRVEIFDELHRGSLKLHAKGGMKKAKKRLAIPPKGSVRRTSRGVSKGQTPRAIIDRTPKRALRITKRGIFVGKGGRLHLRYAFKQSAYIRPDVPFYSEFNRMMSAEAHRIFPTTMANAMKTRRR